MQQDMTYEDAFNELRQITEDIESETITVDELARQVKRASELIAFCQARLRATETEVAGIIRQMESSKD